MTARRFMMPTSSGDPHWDKVSLLMRMDNSLVDATGKHSPYGIRGYSFDTTARFGSHSLHSSAPGNNIPVITVGSTTHIDLLGGSFTVEGWLMPGSFLNAWGVIFTVDLSTNSREMFQAAYGDDRTHIIGRVVNGSSPYFKKINMICANSGSGAGLSSTNEVAINEWVHFAFCRDASTSTNYVFLGGQMASAVQSVVRPGKAPTMSLLHHPAAAYNHGGAAFTGRLDEIRVTKGIARYTAPFTPLASPFWSP